VEALARLNLRPPVFIVPNGIEAARFAALPQRGSLRRRLGLPDGVPVLLFLGRQHQVKQPEVALDALAGLGRPEVHLVYAGPDEENLEGGLRMRAERLGCLGQVHFAGLLKGTEVLQALADADLLVMPSAMESFGMSAVEAMAAGVPVLVSDNVPVGRWAESAGAGRMVPGTAGAFSEAIRSLLAEPEELKTMGERGRELAKGEFDISAVARRMLEQCQSIVTCGRPLAEPRFGLRDPQTSFSAHVGLQVE
jgi:glycosyltransferase involved in cell wall biosynthesis